MNYSVLMSVYVKDNPKWLEESIESILNQTVKTNDFVIVKDGPVTKEIECVINKYVSFYPDIFNILSLEENCGLGPALNKGLLLCKNELVARMDSDDIAKSNRVEKQLEVFNSNDSIDIVGTNAIEFIDNIDNVIDYAVFPESNYEIYKYSKWRNPFCHPSIMFKKSKVIKAGNYQKCYLCEDYDMWIRMIQNNCVCYNIQNAYLYWRVGTDFYKRRSGIKYTRSILSFLRKQYKNGFLSFYEYSKACIIRSVGYMIPNSLRRFIYKRFLRKKEVLS